MILMVTVLIFSACSSDSSKSGTNNNNNNNNHENEQQENEEVFEIDPDLEGDISFWTFTPDIYEEVIEGFNKDYPNINVEVVGVEMGDLHDNLQTTMAAGSGAPDVAQVVQGEFPRYSTEDLLEDLLQSPYDAGRYQEYTSDYSWERWKSVDGKRLLGMPWDITTSIYYYREDLYEQVGLPNDPEELGEYLQDKDNVLNVAQTLAANDMYMFEWRDSPAVQYGDAVGYFDSDYNWTRNSDEMIELLDVVKQGTQIGWSAQAGIFSDEGKQLVNQGKLVSLPLGSWGARDLQMHFPEQEGKWRATKMPLGINFGGGSTFVIPSQGEQKDAAWALVEWMTLAEESWKVLVEHSVQPSLFHITSLPWYEEHTNDYLGGQQDYKLFSSVDSSIPVRRYTPLDGVAWDHFIEGLNDAVDNNIDSKAALNQIEEDAMKELAPEIEELKAEMEKHQ